MPMLQSYTAGWKSLFSYKRLWLWFYLTNILFALIVAIPLSSSLKRVLGSSMAFEKVELFDFTSFGDLLIHHGYILDVIISQAQNVVLIYVLLSVFLVAGLAGLISSVRAEEEYTISSFISSAVRNFWRFLRLTVYVLGLKLLILYIAFKIWTILAGGTNFFSLESSAQWTRAFKIMLPIVILLFTIVSMLGDYIKMSIVSSKRKLIFLDVRYALKNIVQKPFTAISLYFLNIITVSAVLFIFALLRKSLELNSMTMVILSVLLTQLIIIIRLGFKIVNLNSIDHHIESLGE